MRFLQRKRLRARFYKKWDMLRQAGRSHRAFNAIPNQMLGVMRVTYPLDDTQGKYISIYLDPKQSFDTVIALQKHGYKSAFLTVEEWEQLLNAGNKFERHLFQIEDMTDCKTGVEVGNRYIIHFTKRWNYPGVFLSLRSDVPTDSDYDCPSVFISAKTWKTIKNSYNMIQHAIANRVSWKYAAEDVYSTIHSNVVTAMKEKNIDVGDGGSYVNFDLIRQVIDEYLINSMGSEHKDTFDVITFLHEMVVFYPAMF
jgi:hypothetical protein